MNFTYLNPTIIEFGKDKIGSVSNHISNNDKVLVVYGGGSIKKNGVFDEVSKALESHRWLEFGGVEANPSVETLNKAVKLIKKEKVTFILAVGGGSVIDGCKYLAAASKYDGDAWDFLSGQAEVQEALPLGVVVTLAATGSESNNVSVISKKETNDKRFFQSVHIFPKFAVLDPSVMSSLSDRQIANGLVDAFVHSCEQYLTYPTNAMVQDGYALTLLSGLNKLANDWENRKELYWQENMMWIANQALNGLIGMGVPQDWATHMIGHELTAFYGLDHAQSLAVVQPYLLKILEEDKREKLQQMGEIVFGIKNDNDAVIKKIESLYHTVGMSTKLSDYEIDENVVKNIVTSLESKGMKTLGEKAKVTFEIVEDILTESMK